MDIATTCSRVFPSGLRELAERAILFVLDVQYVDYDASDHSCCKTIIGTGMGINCSGDLSNLMYLLKNETGFILNPHVRERFQIKYYGRYMDDMLGIIGRSPNRTNFEREWIAAGDRERSPFLHDKFEFSLHGMDFLDIRVFKNRNRLAYCPFFKPTSLGVPLHSGSSHPSYLHRSWPHAFNARLASNSSSYALYARARRIFTDRLRQYDIDPLIVDSVCKSNAFEAHRNRAGRRRPESALQEFDQVVRPTWLVLPSHPVWVHGGLSRKLKEFLESDVSCMLWELAGQTAGAARIPRPQLQISWKLDAKHLFVQLRNIRRNI